jgi:hypothetical protein
MTSSTNTDDSSHARQPLLMIDDPFSPEQIKAFKDSVESTARARFEELLHRIGSTVRGTSKTGDCNGYR